MGVLCCKVVETCNLTRHHAPTHPPHRTSSHPLELLIQSPTLTDDGRLQLQVTLVGRDDGAAACDLLGGWMGGWMGGWVSGSTATGFSHPTTPNHPTDQPHLCPHKLGVHVFARRNKRHLLRDDALF